jgi:hypothetical protein
MGNNFSHGMPRTPTGNGVGAPQVTVATPLSDLQLLCQMAATILAPMPVPETAEERNAQADLAATRAVDLFGHVCYRWGRGLVTATKRGALNQGETDLKAAIEAEQSQAPAPKIITEGG